MFDLIIIGGGPAGLTAAIYATRAGLSVGLIENAAFGGQISKTHKLENYPGFAEGISGIDFSMEILNQAKRFGTQIIEDTVVSIEKDSKTIVCRNSNYEYKALILALGAHPRKLEIPGEDQFTGMGVSYCATCDGAFFKGYNVAVIGGGNTALEDAIYLSDIADNVYLIHRRDEFRADEILVKTAKNRPNIKFVLNSIPLSINGDFDITSITVKNVKTQEENEISLEGVFIAAGYLPNTELCRDIVKCNSAGYIITDENMKTSVEGIYAAGDIREKSLRQVVTAAADGAIAATEAYRYIRI